MISFSPLVIELLLYMLEFYLTDFLCCSFIVLFEEESLLMKKISGEASCTSFQYAYIFFRLLSTCVM